ncbi:hypothetical protein HZH68_009299 [Vespula germanica]|uniref:Uncharacterized protein n=1 Tax=Vespula germanica TaxID=30212 RepID=A0A834JYF0_VESGE|nr:hypothetical protein HZH68_009299 [Vespula germanica]
MNVTSSIVRKDKTLSVDDDPMSKSLLVLIINYLDNYLSFTEFTEPNCKAIVMIVAKQKGKAIEWTGLRTGGPAGSFSVVDESYESFINDRKERNGHREERERSVSFGVTNAIARSLDKILREDDMETTLIRITFWSDPLLLLMEFKSSLVLRHSSSSRTFSSSFVIVVPSIKLARHFPCFFIIVVKPAWLKK